MTFSERNKLHEKLRTEIRKDAVDNGYQIRTFGQEKMSIPQSYRNKTSWYIRAQPDDLCLSNNGSHLIEIKSKKNDHPNIAIELTPLEYYKQLPQDVYLACETEINSGLPSVKVCKAVDIPINYILIPDRFDNNGKTDALKKKYFDATIQTYGLTDGGSGTPFILVFPNVFNKWMDWIFFRNHFILGFDKWSYDIGTLDEKQTLLFLDSKQEAS